MLRPRQEVTSWEAQRKTKEGQVSGGAVTTASSAHLVNANAALCHVQLQLTGSQATPH